MQGKRNEPFKRRIKSHLPFANIIRSFNVYGSVHRKYIPIYPTRCNVIQLICIWKLLYMFRALLPPVIRSAYNCIYSIWYLSHRYCYLQLSVGTGLSVLWVAYATNSTLKPVSTLPR
jgi:hypothetical protein